MTKADPLIQAIEQALDAHAAALNSTNPVEVERCNQGLLEIVRQLRGRLGDTNRLAPESLEQVRSRLAAHGAMLARASSGNRAALTVLGLTVGQDSLVATPAAPRRGTHLIA